MRSCLHTYRTITNLTQHIIQPWGGGISQVWGGHQPTMGGPSAKYGGGHQPTMGGPSVKYGGAHQPSMGGSSTNYGGPSAKYGGSSTNYGGVINQIWGAISQVWGGGIFPPVCTGSQNPENYFSNTYVLPSVNRTAGPTSSYLGWIKSPHVVALGILKISDLDSLTIFIGGGGYSGVNFGHPKSEVFRNGGGGIPE